MKWLAGKQSVPSRNKAPAGLPLWTSKVRVQEEVNMKLFRIKVFVERETREAIDPLVESIQKLLCPHPAEADHACPQGWFVSLPN